MRTKLVQRRDALKQFEEKKDVLELRLADIAKTAAETRPTPANVERLKVSGEDGLRSGCCLVEKSYQYC